MSLHHWMNTPSYSMELGLPPWCTTWSYGPCSGELINVPHSLKADFSQIRNQNLCTMCPVVSHFPSQALWIHGLSRKLCYPVWQRCNNSLASNVPDLGTSFYLSCCGTTLGADLWSSCIWTSVTLPTPKDLLELVTPVVSPLSVTCASVQTAAIPIQLCPAPAHSNHPANLSKAKPDLRPAQPSSGFKRVYRGHTPTIPKFSRPDPGEFARLRIVLAKLLPRMGRSSSNIGSYSII